MSWLTLIRRNLFRKKMRTFLMLVAIFMAFLVYGVLAMFNQAFNAGIEIAAADRLVTMNKINFTQSMPYAYVNRIRAVDGVQQLTYADWFGGYYQEPRNQIALLAVDSETWFKVYPEVVINDVQKQAYLQDRTGLLIGDRLAARFNWKVGDRIPLPSSIYRQENGAQSWDFTIRGIFTANAPEIDTNYAIFHHDYFNETRDIGKDTIGWIVLTTGNPDRNEQVMRDIDAMFANSPYETESTTEQAFNKAFIEQIGSIGLIITSVVTAAFLTILMIVGNSMYRAIQERTKEIAVMKTLGFRPKHILTLVLAESFCLAVFGGTLGLLGAWGIMAAVGPMVAAVLPSLAMTWNIAFSTFFFIFLLGLITGAAPAWQAMRLNIQTGLGRA